MTRLKLSKRLLLAVFTLFSISHGYSSEWLTISADAENDVSNTAWADCSKMEYAYDEFADELSFRFTVANMSASIAANFGINVMVNIEGSSSGKFNFWGKDNGDKFQYILTAWVTGTPPSDYSGTIGVANASGAKNSNMTNLHSNNLDIQVDEMGGTITVTVAREEFIPDTELGSGKTDVTFAGATGNSMGWNDDVYDASKTVSLPISTPTSVSTITKAGVSLYPNPAVNRITVSGIQELNSVFTIYNNLGQVVLEGILENGMVDVSALDVGIFFIALEKSPSVLRFTK